MQEKNKTNKIKSRTTGIMAVNGEEICVGDCVRELRTDANDYLMVERDKNGSVVLRKCFDKTKPVYPITDYAPSELLRMTMDKSTLMAVKNGHKGKTRHIAWDWGIVLLLSSYIAMIVVFYYKSKDVIPNIVMWTILMVGIFATAYWSKVESFFDKYKLKKMNNN